MEGEAMEKREKNMNDLEKLITVRIMQEDTETIYSLLQNIRDPIFAMEIMPYYALFVQSCQEYMGETFIDKNCLEKIQNARNFIKVYGESFGKSIKRIESVDANQDEQYKVQLRFDFMKNWNIHLNMGTYWTSDKHLVGNTQRLADFLGIDDIFDSQRGEMQYKLGEQIGAFITSLRDGFAQIMNPPEIKMIKTDISIDYYYDLNTNKEDRLFCDNSQKALNIFFLNMTCNLNFLKYILRPLLDVNNKWLFRVEYIVIYYAYRSIQRLKNYCENNTDLCVDLEEFVEVLNLGGILFQSRFRNCMMHYGLENQGVISIENVEKPFYGIIETCYDGKDYNSFLKDLRNLSEKILTILEEKFNVEDVILEHL